MNRYFQTGSVFCWWVVFFLISSSFSLVSAAVVSWDRNRSSTVSSLKKKSTIFSVRDKMNWCFPGNGMFFIEYSNVYFSIFSYSWFVVFLSVELSTVFSTHYKERYLRNIHKVSKEFGCEIFVYRIYESFHINLWECSMYGYYYVFLSGCI